MSSCPTCSRFSPTQPDVDQVAHGSLAGIGQPGVSRQLQILEDAEFVVVRPEGRRRLYSLRPEPFRELSEFLTGYRGIWEGRLDRFAAALERRRRNKDNKEKSK